MGNRALLVLTAAILTGVPLTAHDFWLAASPWTPASLVAINANLGDRFPRSTDYTAPERVDRWRLVGSDGEVPVTRDFRRDGTLLAVDVAVPRPGA